jgi:uncharacterized protein (DUF2236 family)
MMSRLSASVRSHLLETFSGDSNGTPYWVANIEQGDDIGFFGPGSASWAVHGGMPTMVAGIRALLMQTLHPGAMAGVHDWSRYKEDPLGRLAGTIQWLITVTFGDTALARRESGRVAMFHERVRGTYVDAQGVERPYSAGDPELLYWVHVVFTDAFLGCHETWGGPIPGGADQYVDEWAVAGELVGVASPPRSERELRDAMHKFNTDGILKHDERVEETIAFLKNPPLRRSMMPFYRVMFAGAVASIPEEYRQLLGLRAPRWPARWATGVILGILRGVLGPSSTSEDAARRRIARLGDETTLSAPA